MVQHVYFISYLCRHIWFGYWWVLLFKWLFQFVWCHKWNNARLLLYMHHTKLEFILRARCVVFHSQFGEQCRCLYAFDVRLWWLWVGKFKKILLCPYLEDWSYMDFYIICSWWCLLLDQLADPKCLPFWLTMSCWHKTTFCFSKYLRTTSTVFQVPLITFGDP